MDLINWVIEESKWNILSTKDNKKYTIIRKFQPHSSPRWSKREILEDQLRSLTSVKRG